MRGVGRIRVSLFCLLLLASAHALGAQDDEPPAVPAKPAQDNQENKKAAASERASELSSSKDTRIDLAPPKDDAQKHPLSGGAIIDDENQDSDVQEFHPWDPHKAAKDIEIGDFYYKRKNYRAALDRYKEALFYKPNDALANFRLAECQEKTGNPNEALGHYQEYLKLLPHGPLAGDAEKAIEQLKGTSAKQSSAN